MAGVQSYPPVPFALRPKPGKGRRAVAVPKAPDSQPAAPRPVRDAAPHPTELQLHSTIAIALDRLLAEPALWTTVNLGHLDLTERQRGRMARVGVKPGWPDIVVVYNRHIYGLELKTPSGRVSTGQRARFALLEAAGMIIAVCRSLDDVLLALQGWGVPLKVRLT